MTMGVVCCFWLGVDTRRTGLLGKLDLSSWMARAAGILLTANGFLDCLVLGVDTVGVVGVVGGDVCSVFVSCGGFEADS